MGGDGGCIASRVDMVKTKGYGFLRGPKCGGMGITPSVVCRTEEDRIGRVEGRKMQMGLCNLSQEKLRHPVAVCRLGHLMNKEMLMEGLLSKSLGTNFEHIRSLKDVKTVKIELVDSRPVCPISKRELDDGGCRSIALWNCGCVMEQKSYQQGKDAKTKIDKCVVCGADVTEVIPLAPDEDELEEMRKKLPQRKKKRPAAESVEEKEAKEAKTEKTTTTMKLSENLAKMHEAKHTRDGFGCPAYARRN